MKSWNDEETKRFIELYPNTPTLELVGMFGRSESALVTKAYKLGVKKVSRADGLKYIYEKEQEEIIEYAKTHSISDTARSFDRDYMNVRNILLKNDSKIISSIYWWTEDEENFLKENFELGNPEYISDALNRRWRTITKKARTMGMKRFTKNGIPHKSPKLITNEEKEFIENNYNKIPSAIIAKILNRQCDVIINFCEKNNLDILRSRKNPKDYSDIFLLNELNRLAIEFGRCPTSGEIQNNFNLPSVDIYYDRFGSFSNACELAGLMPNIGYYGTICYSKNGDKCYSVSEQIITNYIIDNEIKYIKEYEYRNVLPTLDSGIVMDWYINDSIVVEYFGMQKFEKYELKTEMKQEICRKNNIRMIPLFPEDMKYLDKIFCEFINKTP